MGLNYAKLKDLEALRDNLVHMVVHDMKSALSGVSGCLQLLNRAARKQMDPAQGRFLDEAAGFTSDLLEMVRSLLDVSRMEAGQMPLTKTRCEVGALVAEAMGVVESVAQQKHMRLAWYPQTLFAECDREVIVRVLANLLVNAVKFAPADSEIRVAAEGTGDMITLSVTDDGPGVPIEFHKKIFEKFGRVETQKTGKDFSTGLGLTFCKLAVEAHGGLMGVKSPVNKDDAAGKGSKFWFTLHAAA